MSVAATLEIGQTLGNTITFATFLVMAGLVLITLFKPRR